MIMIMITRGRADQQRGLCGEVWGRVQCCPTISELQAWT
eukprot:COSAG02_NODE_40787_length_401_cov_1.139073_2_plen_38_part_01